VRESLRHHLFRQIRRGRLRSLGRLWVRARALRRDAPPAHGPEGPLLATLAITYRCPLGCEMCDLPAQARGEPSDEELLRWIDAIARLGPAGLGITGGEPLVRKSLESVLARAVKHGLVTHLNTSGLGLGRERAERLIATGLDSINLSIDHDQARVHDRWRGREGAQAAAFDALDHLHQARRRQKRATRLQVMMAVGRDTLERVPHLERLARAAGADALSLLPVHDFPAGGGNRPWPAHVKVPAELRGPGLENSPAYRAGILPFLEGAATPVTCSAPRSGLFIDPSGGLFPCTPAATARAGGAPNIRATPDTLVELYRRGGLAATIPEGRCGRCWWNCHRELDLALGVLGDRKETGQRLDLP